VIPSFDTYILVGDTHDWGVAQDLDGYGVMTDPNIRQVNAINDCRGLPHPLGGSVGKPLAVFQLGDFKHNDFGTVDRIASYYKRDGSGLIKFPCRVIRGNHDDVDVANWIIAGHGSLTWGEKIGRVFFQAMTETFVSLLDTNPPNTTQINGPVATSVNARPANEPLFFLVHRSVEWNGEWETPDPNSLNALETLALSKNTLGILHGHDHNSRQYTWRGFKTFSPGSVAMAPMTPPYTATFPESFIVLRVADTWYDVANFVFGWDVNRFWTPGTWEWWERVPYHPTGSGLSVQATQVLRRGDPTMRRVRYNVKFDKSYLTGGEELDCSRELRRIHEVRVESGHAGYMVVPNSATRDAKYAQGKADLMVYRQTAATGPLVQVPNGTDLATLRVNVIVDGR